MNYDALNKQKLKYESILKDKDSEIEKLKKAKTDAEKKYDDLRKEMHDTKTGKGEINHLKEKIVILERDLATYKNKLKDMDKIGKMVKEFIPSRQELISKIKCLNFNNNLYNALAIKFRDGLDNVLELAYRIKMNHIEDMDYFTFVFRDNIVGLFEKMLGVVLDKSEGSSSKYLVKVYEGSYTFPVEYTKGIPLLKDKNVIYNILHLTNLQSTGYHGTKVKQKKTFIDPKTGESIKPDHFLNLNKVDQLNAIFTLLEFMYFVFTNKDWEMNLINISQSWYKTI